MSALRNFIGLIALFSAGTLFSAEGDSGKMIPPPKPPLLSSAPEGMVWIISIRPLPKDRPDKGVEVKAKAKEAALPELRQIEVIHSNGLRREVRLFSDERRAEQWIADGVLFRQNPVSKLVIMESPAWNPEVTDYTRSGFPELDWVSPAHFEGMTQYNKRECHLYRKEWSGSAKAANGGGRINGQEVLIDGETRLPVLFRNQEAQWTYSFKPYSGPPLLLPDNFKAEWERYQEVINRPNRYRTPQ